MIASVIFVVKSYLVLWDLALPLLTVVVIKKYIFISKMIHPYNKVHGANMGATWVLSAPGGPHVGLMNLASWAHQAPDSIPVSGMLGSWVGRLGIRKTHQSCLANHVTVGQGWQSVLEQDKSSSTHISWRSVTTLLGIIPRRKMMSWHGNGFCHTDPLWGKIPSVLRTHQ